MAAIEMAIWILAIQASFNVEISSSVKIIYQTGLIFEFTVIINLFHRFNNIFEILTELMMDRKFIIHLLLNSSDFISEIILFHKELIPFAFILEI